MHDTGRDVESHITLHKLQGLPVTIVHPIHNDSVILYLLGVVLEITTKYEDMTIT